MCQFCFFHVKLSPIFEGKQGPVWVRILVQIVRTSIFMENPDFSGPDPIRTPSLVFGKLTKCSLGPFHQQRWNGYSTSAGDTSKGGITIPPLLVIFSPKNAIRYGIFRPLVVILSFRSLHRNVHSLIFFFIIPGC